jgi:hypothetical protein
MLNASEVEVDAEKGVLNGALFAALRHTDW